jgi:hypothetical protein
MSHEDPFLAEPIRRSGEWNGLSGNLKTEPTRREIILVLDYCGSSTWRTRGLELCRNLEQLLKSHGLVPDLPDIDPNETLIQWIIRVPEALEFGELFQEIHTFLKRCKRSG